MKIAVSIIILLQVLLCIFFMGIYQTSLENTYALGFSDGKEAQIKLNDEANKTKPLITDPAQWWFGTTSKTEARKRLCK